MQWNQSKKRRMLMIAGGLLTLAMALVGPRSIWGLLGILPVLAGLVGPEPLLQISGRPARRRGDLS